MSTWIHIGVHSQAQALDLMRALGDYRSCVVQDTADEWSIYVHADPELIADIAEALGLTDYHAVDASELAAAGISQP